MSFSASIEVEWLVTPEMMINEFVLGGRFLIERETILIVVFVVSVSPIVAYFTHNEPIQMLFNVKR